jgi:hypothetical protein
MLLKNAPFKSLYEMKGKNMFVVDEESKRTREIYGPLNSTFVTYTPKVDNPPTFDAFKTNITLQPYK